jgi:hypothetical protein
MSCRIPKYEQSNGYALMCMQRIQNVNLDCNQTRVLYHQTFHENPKTGTVHQLKIYVILAYLSVETLLPFSAQLEVVYVRCYLIVEEVLGALCLRARESTLREMRRLGRRSFHSR